MTLHLNLHKENFDNIASGFKKVEYREIKKYWTQRLFNKPYDTITFSNGFAKNRRQMVVEWIDTDTGLGNPHWGAPMSVNVYRLKLGKILTKNF